MLKKLWRPIMRKQASSTAANLVSIRVPKKLAGKRVVLVDAAEYAALKRRLTEITDALEKISRGDAAYRQGRTKSVSSLSELGR
jgi:PHD/YefM family antitoxin component YafN of YafNO toxin-antitoxin module